MSAFADSGRGILSWCGRHCNQTMLHGVHRSYQELNENMMRMIARRWLEMKCLRHLLAVSDYSLLAPDRAAYRSIYTLSVALILSPKN